MPEEGPLLPENEYRLTRHSLIDVTRERLEHAAVFVGNQAVTALWVGRPAPREFAEPCALDAAELRLTCRMSLGGMVLMWADLRAPGVQHLRRYQFDGEDVPDSLNQSSALADEQIRLVLGRDITFDLEAADTWGAGLFMSGGMPRHES